MIISSFFKSFRFWTSKEALYFKYGSILKLISFSKVSINKNGLFLQIIEYSLIISLIFILDKNV